MEFSSDSFSYFAIAGMVVFVIYSYFKEKERSEELELIAKDKGFKFSKIVTSATKEKIDGFNLFKQGHSHCFENEVRLVDSGNDISIFEYSYSIGYGKSSQTYNQSVIFIESNKFCFPQFELKPENLFHKIKDILVSQDIDFESYPKFSKKYLLRGEDEDKIRELFQLKVIRFFESKHGYCAEANNNYFVFYISSERAEPHQINDFIKTGQKVLSKFTNT